MKSLGNFGEQVVKLGLWAFGLIAEQDSTPEAIKLVSTAIPFGEKL